MIIRSKKTNQVHEITHEDWAKIKARMQSHNFEIIDSAPGTFRKVEIDIPQMIKEIPKEDYPMTVRALKEALTERGVEFPKNAKKQELIEIYERKRVITKVPSEDFEPDRE